MLQVISTAVHVADGAVRLLSEAGVGGSIVLRMRVDVLLQLLACLIEGGLQAGGQLLSQVLSDDRVEAEATLGSRPPWPVRPLWALAAMLLAARTSARAFCLSSRRLLSSSRRLEIWEACMVVAVASSEMALLRPLIQLWARRRALGGTKESRFLTEVWIAAIGTCVGLSWAVLAGGVLG